MGVTGYGWIMSGVRVLTENLFDDCHANRVGSTTAVHMLKMLVLNAQQQVRHAIVNLWPV